MDFLGYELGKNTLGEWLLAVGIGLALLLVSILVRNYLSKKKVRETSNIFRYLFLIRPLLAKTHVLFLLVLAFYLSLSLIELSAKMARVREVTFILAMFCQLVLWINSAIASYVSYYVSKKQDADLNATTAINILGILAKFVFFTSLLLLTLDQLGVNVTTLIAGLGVGGIAIALAVQNILGDLFASLTIILDRPFKVGDFLVIGELRGNVQKVGLKTTRIRSLDGEEIIFPNNDLLQSKIRNFQPMVERRVVFAFGVLYETTPTQLRRIPEAVREIIEAQKLTRFDRAHFKNFGDFSLNFEVVYFILSPDFNTYMDIQQEINLLLLERLAQEGVEFAYPTQLLYHKNQNLGLLSPS